MGKSFVVLVAAVGILSSACATSGMADAWAGVLWGGSSRREEPAKPKIELRCTPRMAMGASFGPVTVMAFMSVKNPGEKFWCPAVEWYLNGEKSGGHESDCDPYVTVMDEQGKFPKVWSEPVKYFSFYEGEHTITAKLLMSGNVIGSESCQVTAR